MIQESQEQQKRRGRPRVHPEGYVRNKKQECEKRKSRYRMFSVVQEDEVKPPIKRPPAEYSNKSAYDKYEL
jgi:hypothetical protein